MALIEPSKRLGEMVIGKKGIPSLRSLQHMLSVIKKTQ